MPLKLVPPRKGKSPNYSIRGTYLRVAVDRSSGTPRKALAGKIKRDLEGKIERGEYPEKAPEPKKESESFLQAAIEYMKAGGERSKMARVISYFGEKPWAEITQADIDKGALEVLPNVTPATRNRQFYTPACAVIRYKNPDFRCRRPKGAKGRILTSFMQPADAQVIIAAADSFDFEFGTYLIFLIYAGPRRSEPLKQLFWETTDLAKGTAIFGTTKNGSPRSMKLHTEIVRRFAILWEQQGKPTSGRVFANLRVTGGFKDKLLRAKLLAEGREMPKRVKGASRRQPAHRYSWVTFHVFRHTWATWMRQYGGIDVLGLVGTDNWKDARSAARYAHVVPRTEWERVEQLPDVTRGIVVELKKNAG